MAEKIRVQHLLVKHTGSRNPTSWKSPTITRSKAEALELLAGYRERIVKREIEFGALARTESDCRSAARGGDLGFFERGQMQKEFETAAFALAVGELSGYISSDSGVHIIFRTG